jgi:methionine synthase II (cobalamin-independent)
VEEETALEQRFRQALEVLPKESIWVAPSYGLKTRTVDEGHRQDEDLR